MRNPFRREKALTGDGGVVSAIQNGGWSAFPLLGNQAKDRILRIYNTAQGANYGWLYSKSPAVRTVLDKIVRDVGELELRLYEEVSEAERQPKPDHPAALSLRYPNEETPADQFIRSIVKDYLIHDNAYAYLFPAADGQVGLIRIPAFMVEVQSSTMFRVENYRVWPQGAWTTAGAWGGAGTYVDFTPDQIMHWHGEHPHDSRVGLSHLDTLRGVIAEDAALQQATVELANAGLQEPVWAYRPLEAPDISNLAKQGLEEDLTNRMRRRNSKVVVMEEGMELRSFGVSPRDAQMLEVRKWAVSQVAAEYAVPSGKVGLTPATEEDETAYIGDVLKPITSSLTATLDHRILVKVYDWTKGCFAFNLDDRMMGDDRLRALTSAAGVPILLRNEARAMVNRPPVEGGDDPATPANVILGSDPEALMVARAAASAPKPGSQVMPIQDPNKPPQDGSYRQDQGSTPVASANAGKELTEGERKALYQLPLGDGDPSERLPQLHPGFSADIERQRRNIDQTKAVVQRLFNRIDRVARQKAAISKRDWGRWEREFSADLDKALHGIVASEGTLYSMKLGGANFDMGQVTNYLGAMSQGVASAVIDTVKGDVGDLGADEALAKAPQHVASVGTSLGARATMWAREEAAKQAPDPERRVKTWIADTGRHAEFNGDTVALEADWPAGFAPGQEPGCGCSMSVR